MRVSGCSDEITRPTGTETNGRGRIAAITGAGHFHHHLNNMPIIIRKSVELLLAGQRTGKIERRDSHWGIELHAKKRRNCLAVCSMNSSGNLLVSRESHGENHLEYVHKK